GRELLLCQRVQRPWAAAGAGGRPRHRRTDRLRRLSQPRLAPLRLRAGLEQSTDLRVERGVTRNGSESERSTPCPAETQAASRRGMRCWRAWPRESEQRTPCPAGTAAAGAAASGSGASLAGVPPETPGTGSGPPQTMPATLRGLSGLPA